MKITTYQKADSILRELHNLEKMKKGLANPRAAGLTLYWGDSYVHVGEIPGLGQTILDIASAEVNRQIAAREQQFRDLQDDPNDPEDG